MTPLSKPRKSASGPEDIARRFHETYEELAPVYGYETRRESAVPWDEVPAANKRLMVKVCSRLLHEGTIQHGSGTSDELRDAAMSVVLAWDAERTQHLTMPRLREALGLPPGRPTPEEAEARLSAYIESLL